MGFEPSPPRCRCTAPPVELSGQLKAGRMWVDCMTVDGGYRSAYILMHDIHVSTSYIHKSISMDKIKVIKIK